MLRMREYLYNLATDRAKGLLALVLKALLFFLSILYGVLVTIICMFSRMRRSRFSCKVISVGNITLGGTGKTVLVEYICRILRDKGHKVAVISRGYKRPFCDSKESTAAAEFNTMGDEPYMLTQNLPGVVVVVSKDRGRGIRRAIEEYGVDAVVLDDGFQQWKIHKDLEIVAIDALNPFGNSHLLPRGILRQPRVTLKLADIIVLTKTDFSPEVAKLKAYISRVNPKALLVETKHSPVGFYNIRTPETLLAPELFRGKKVMIFSGIGDPSSFEQLLKELGVIIALKLVFPDHHPYTPDDINKIARLSRSKKIDTIITTQKDAMRLTQGLGVEISALRIQLQVTSNEQGLLDRLLGLYSF